MTLFEKKSLAWLVVGSIVAAGGGMAWHATSVGLLQAQESLRQVKKSETDFADLKTRLAKWIQTHDQGKADQGKLVALKIEPVALSADFAPGELSGIGAVLSGMYSENGSLNLKSFTLNVGTSTHITLFGDKIFIPRRPTPDRVVLLPNADGSPSAVILKSAAGEQIIDHPYQAASVSPDGAITLRTESAESVKARYGEALAAQPKRPVSYILYFDSGKDEIEAGSKPVLDKMKADLKTRNAPEITVIGHTDRVGKPVDNDPLSLSRAKVMREILIANGVSAKLIQTAGRGDRELAVKTAHGIAEEKNRRVEINVR